MLQKHAAEGGWATRYPGRRAYNENIARAPGRIEITVDLGSLKGLMNIRWSAALIALLLSHLAPAQEAPKPAAAAPPAAAGEAKRPDRAAAYYHFTQAHIYEELMSIYGRSEYAAKAVQEYKLAIENDPASSYLNAGLAELYYRTGRIRDAVLEAQESIQREPGNLEARRLLGRIYLRSMGDPSAGAQSQEMLRLATEQFEQIVKLDPKSIEDHLMLGRLYRLNNQNDKAEAEFKSAMSAQPASEEAITSLAYLYDEQGEAQRAVDTLLALPETARSPRVYATLGYSYEQKKDYKNAIEAFRRAYEMDKDNLDAARGLAQNLLNDNQVEAALEQYKAIAEADPQDPQAQLRIAEIDRHRGKFDTALDRLKHAAVLLPDSVEIPYNIALVYQAQGKYDDAIALLQQLLRKNEKPDANGYTASDRSNRALFLERLGGIYRDANRNQQAIEAFRKMADLGEESASRGYDQMVETYRESRQYAQALAAAQEGASKYPENRSFKLDLAAQQADNGQADAAIASVKALLKGTAEDREIYLALANLESRLRRWSDAEEALNQAEKFSKPEEKDSITFMRGALYERQKKYEQAEEMFRRVLVGDPQSAGVLNYLGYMLADRGLRLEEALGFIKKAVEQEPLNGAYLDSLGWVYFKMGNYEQAEEYLRKASEKISNDGTIQDHLAELYAKTGRLRLAAARWERSLEEWSRATPSDVDPADVARVQKKLDAARVKLARQAAGKQQ